MTNKPNVTSKYEEERLRAAEQSQIVYLQGQIDELRRLIKDQSNKYNWAMEQVRKVEATAAQTEGLFERYRQEVGQSLDGYRRDIANLRKEVAEVLDGCVRPGEEQGDVIGVRPADLVGRSAVRTVHLEHLAVPQGLADPVAPDDDPVSYVCPHRPAPLVTSHGHALDATGQGSKVTARGGGCEGLARAVLSGGCLRVGAGDGNRTSVLS